MNKMLTQGVEMSYKKQLFFFFSFLLMTSLIYSPFLLTISMIGLGLVSFLDFGNSETGFKAAVDKPAMLRLKHAFQYPDLLLITAFFLVVLLSFWQTEHYGYWLERLRIKLPFILLPIAFIAYARFSKRELQHIFYFLLILLSLTGLGVCIYYIINFEEINLLMSKGHPVPTPRNHIRFSLLVAVGIIGGIYLITEKYYLRHTSERRLIIILTLFLSFFIHLLSVRSGLIVLYAALLVWLLQYALVAKRYTFVAVAVVIIFSIPVTAYYFIPSFNKRIGYMLHDLDMYNQGKGGAYADAGRLVSLKAGWKIAKDHPLFGVGAGNLRHEVDETYRLHFPDYHKPIMPHNQFLFVLAGTGLFGLLLFCFAFAYPLFYRNNYLNPLLLAFYTLFFVAFVIEHTIENAAGVGTFSFFLLLLLNHLKPTDIIIPPSSS